MYDPTGKKKTIEDYYNDELRYLDEAGREFAEAHPLRAKYLNLNQRDDRDPYVERLFEGFAFLTGRIRQKLDDELPEITQSLMGLLWPHFLKPIPSLSVLEFQAMTGRVQEPHIIANGTEVASQPVGREAQVCRFQTCYEVHIRPIELSNIVLEDNNHVLTFQFNIEQDIDYNSLFSIDNLVSSSPERDEYQRHRRRSIRLFIHDVDRQTSSELYLYLMNHAEKVVIEAIQRDARPSSQSSVSVTLQGQEGIQPVGFTAEEGLLPYTDYSFYGYRVLQEYFVYPRKFMFFDLFGFHLIRASEQMGTIRVSVHFDRPFPIDRRFSKNNFRLNCTPIINLFETEAEPILINHERTEYRINAPDGNEVYSVKSVAGIVSGTTEPRTYLPFYSFRHSIADTISNKGRRGRYYNTVTRLETRLNEEGQPEPYQVTYITALGLESEIEELSEETLSLDIVCTNGSYARECKVGDICNPTVNSRVPEFVRFRNLYQPGLILYPPMLTGLEWRFISHLALNYLSLTNVEAMRSILQLYNWSIESGNREANHRRITSIHSIRAKPQDIINRGIVVRCIEVNLEIIEDNFEDRGDIYLFGLIMREFLELYTTINSAIQVIFTSYETKEELFRWTPEVMSNTNRELLTRRRRLPL
jgi:type VI secretion system protein ImpG